MTSTATPRKATLPPLVLPDGTLELLKWAAVVLMTIDHVNKFLLAASHPWMFWLGRLAMPLFTAVLAYNLARPGAREKGVYKRTLGRLLLIGALTSAIFLEIGATVEHSGWPLNIMFLFAAIVACVWLIEIGGYGAKTAMVFVFLISGALAEYLWFGIGFGIAVWSYSKRPSWTAAIFAIVLCASLNMMENVYWSLLALPLLFLAPRIDLRVPRLRFAFYAYYPLHLAAIWVIQRTTSLGTG
ncbi:MAG: conjugal transfer protein TraX [Xanthomonadaceae bacterium]|nr:conjugal transfer protein TraX [Xanthomonadaceae bacterium]